MTVCPFLSGENIVSNLPKNTTPIWHSPVWITAIVGLVSAFLTVPEIVSSYLSKQQDIELAKEKTREQSVKNENDKQALEFSIVNNTLAQQGAERVFVLRYLARTLDDADAQAWAQEEVARLDQISLLEQELDQKTAELTSARRDLDEASAANEAANAEKLQQIEQELENRTAELNRLLRESGISSSANAATQRSAPVRRSIDRIIFAPTNWNSIEKMRDAHLNLGWSDAGGHFLVTSAGQVERGRDLSRIAAIVRQHNKTAIAIFVHCPPLMENGGSTLGFPNNALDCGFSDSQINAARTLLRSLREEFEVAEDMVFENGDLDLRRPKMALVQQLLSEPGVAVE